MQYNVGSEAEDVVLGYAGVLVALDVLRVGDCAQMIQVFFETCRAELRFVQKPEGECVQCAAAEVVGMTVAAD